jgi:hypothetical protein
MATKVCPQCQTEIDAAVEQCPHCQTKLPGDINPYQSPPETTVDLQVRQWTLLYSGVFIVLAMVLFPLAPGLAMPLILLTIPATVRALLIQQRLGELERPSSWLGQLHVLLVSACVVAAILGAGVVAFGTICFSTAMVVFSIQQDWAIILAIVGTAVAVGCGIAAPIYTARALWWPRDLKKQ